MALAVGRAPALSDCDFEGSRALSVTATALSLGLSDCGRVGRVLALAIGRALSLVVGHALALFDCYRIGRALPLSDCGRVGRTTASTLRVVGSPATARQCVDPLADTYLSSRMCLKTAILC